MRYNMLGKDGGTPNKPSTPITITEIKTDLESIGAAVLAVADRTDGDAISLFYNILQGVLQDSELCKAVLFGVVRACQLRPELLERCEKDERDCPCGRCGLSYFAVQVCRHGRQPEEAMMLTKTRVDRIRAEFRSMVDGMAEGTDTEGGFGA